MMEASTQRKTSPKLLCAFGIAKSMPKADKKTEEEC